MARLRSWRDERGFNLVEVMVTIAILGILAGIAVSTWFGLVESRRVDSAANQLLSDMRLANISATNQLVTYEVVLNPGSNNYQFGQQGSLTARSLPSGTMVAPSPATTVEGVRFLPDGSAQRISGTGNTITVSSNNGSPNRVITFNEATSRIKSGP